MQPDDSERARMQVQSPDPRAVLTRLQILDRSAADLAPTAAVGRSQPKRYGASTELRSPAGPMPERAGQTTPRGAWHRVDAAIAGDR